MLEPVSLMRLTRAAAIGAVVVGSLTGAATALAAGPDTAVPLDHQMEQHLGPSGQATFQFHYAGSGDLAQITLLPSGASVASQLSVKVLGPDNQPVELYDAGSTDAALKDEIVKGPAGTYTVQVNNADGQTPADFAISADDTPMSTGDSTPVQEDTDTGSTTTESNP